MHTKIVIILMVRKTSGGRRCWLIEVRINGNESLENALRRFSRKVQQEGILAEYRRRQYFEKPSITRKKKRATKKRKSTRSSRGAYTGR
jgi:small subunit ribosomal protein S21